MNRFAILKFLRKDQLLRNRGFTLIELLIVLAVITVLAAILFPVFMAARASARQAVCINNFRQASLASGLYNGDYDDYYAPSSYSPVENATSTLDRTWVQALMPYTRDFPVFRCPADFTARPDLDATFDEDLVPGDAYSRYYQASKRSNIGYNYIYFSPVVRRGSAPFHPIARVGSQVANPSSTIVFVDSVWEVDEEGRPSGGGSYLVLPPCRYVGRGPGRRDTFRLNGFGDDDIFRPQDYWKTQTRMYPLSYGGAWPWHSQRMTVSFADGRVRSYGISQLLKGCDAQDDWATGSIFDPSAYEWDLD